MTRTGLQNLAELTAAVHRAHEAQMRSIFVKEQRLREDLATLASQAKEVQRLPAENLMELQRYGGDVLWQAYLSRARRDLNMKLAQVLALKAQTKRRLQRTHGRNSAAKALAAQAEKQARTERSNAMLSIEQMMSVLKAAGARKEG